MVMSCLALNVFSALVLGESAYNFAKRRRVDYNKDADKRIRTPAGTKPLDSESNPFDRSGTSA